MTTIQSDTGQVGNGAAIGSLVDLRQLADSTFGGGAEIEVFDREANAVRAARRFVSGVVGAEAEVHDVALLVASELCANAVIHARTPFVVAVSTGIGRARISVGDLSPAEPVPAPASVSSLTGRGLLLIDALSSAWGCEPWSTGKVVWAELAPA